MGKKAVISMSGGLDSTMLAMKLLSEGYEVKAYAFDYGQKHRVELDNLRKCVIYINGLEGELSKYHIDLQIVNLKGVFNESNSSLRGVGEIPTGEYDEEGMKSTVIENRNCVFSSIIYSKALSWANRTKENVDIFLGIHSGDHALYPDTTEESRAAAEHLFKISNWGSERVNYKAPFVDCTKAELLNVGISCMNDMGLDKVMINNILKMTHSCYNPDEYRRSCGECGTCKERLQAFEANGMKDPIKYVWDETDVIRIVPHFKKQGEEKSE